MMRFDRFTERAQDAAMRAYEITKRYRHTQVDAEHLLLALLEQPEGVIPEILQQLEVDLEAMSRRLNGDLHNARRTQIYGGGVNQVYITPRLKRVIDQSNDEAMKLRDDYISTEHFLLAIAGERNTPAGRILAGSGVTRQRILDAMEELRSRWDTSPPPERKPLPSELAIETVLGRNPELVLSQRENRLRIPLRDAMAVIAALAEAAAEVQSLQSQSPFSGRAGG